MFSSYRPLPQANGLRPRQGFVESESEFTGDDSVKEYPSAVESEIALVSENAYEEYPSAVESESAVEGYPSSAVESESAVEVTDYTEDESEVSLYKKSVRWTTQDDGKARRFRKYKKTAQPFRRQARVRKIKKFILDVRKLIVFNIAAILLLALGIGTGSWVLGRVGEKAAGVICTQGPSSYISSWLTLCNPLLQLPEVQEGIRAQSEFMDLQDIFASHDEMSMMLEQGQNAMKDIRSAIHETMPRTEDAQKISEALAASIDLTAKFGANASSYTREANSLIDHMLRMNKRMRDSLKGVELPEETPPPSLGFWDKVQTFVGSPTFMSRPTSSAESPHRLYQSYTATLSQLLNERNQQTDELLAHFITLAKSVGTAQMLLGSISSSGKAEPVQRRSWVWIFNHLKDHLDKHSHAREAMEALSGSFERIQRKYCEGSAKVNNIKAKIDTLSQALAGSDAGFEDEVGLELWNEEVQEVIEKLEPGPGIDGRRKNKSDKIKEKSMSGAENRRKEKWDKIKGGRLWKIEKRSEASGERNEKALIALQEGMRAQSELAKLQRINEPNDDVLLTLGDGSIAVSNIEWEIRRRLPLSEEREKISSFLLESKAMFDPIGKKLGSHASQINRLASHTLFNNKRILDALPLVALKEDTPLEGLIDKFLAWVDPSTNPLETVFRSYKQHVRGLGESLAKRREEGEELLQNFMVFERSINNAQLYLGSVRSSGRNKQLQSWAKIFTQFQHELKNVGGSFQVQGSMEALTSCFEGVKKSLREGNSKIREIKTKIDRLASALEGLEVGDDDKLNVWKKEIQDVIKELEAANEAAEKSRARFHKIQTTRSDVIDESSKASAKY